MPHCSRPTEAPDEQGLSHFKVKSLTQKLERPLALDELRREPILASASFLKSGRAGTVFPLSEEQARRLHVLVAEHNDLPADAAGWFSFRAPEVARGSRSVQSELFPLQEDHESQQVSFREDEDSARQVFEQLFLDDRIRYALARALAQSIREAHVVAPNAWGVSLFSNLIRLNVGMPNLMALTAGPSMFMAENDGTLCEKVARISSRATVGLLGRYANLPTASIVEVPLKKFAHLYQRFHREHRESIAIAGRGRGSPQTISHSPGVLKYLRRLGLEVPDPTYAHESNSIPAEAAAIRGQREVEPFDPASIEDGRRRTLQSIAQRRGQSTFRKQLFAAYGERCALTNCEVPWVLEAAHIVPYRGQKTHHVANGLLLRADLHVLFDLGLLRIDPESLTVELDPSLHGTSYAELSGRQLRLPSSPGQRPSVDALAWHAQQSRSRVSRLPALRDRKRS